MASDLVLGRVAADLHKALHNTLGATLDQQAILNIECHIRGALLALSQGGLLTEPQVFNFVLKPTTGEPASITVYTDDFYSALVLCYVSGGIPGLNAFPSREAFLSADVWFDPVGNRWSFCGGQLFFTPKGCIPLY